MRKRKRIAISRILVAAAVFAAALILLLAYSDRGWNEKYSRPEKREEGNTAFMEEGLVTWNGDSYRKKPAMTLILVAGIDKETEEQGYARTRYRSGGQADFLLLLAVDHGEKKIHQLQIDRDTMAQITILGVYGNETGTRELQICLAHSFGSRPDDNAKYTVRAVKNLLGGEIEIDGYYIMDYSAVPVFTDALDGVPVTIPEDMTGVNPEWFEGHTITLRGQDAETFVRTRKTVGQGTNAERMNRQGIYMRSAINRIHQNLARDENFASALLATMRRIVTTNLSEQRLLEEINAARSYEVLSIDTLPGEYVLADNGFMEFYPEEGAAESWVMTHLYTLR